MVSITPGDRTVFLIHHAIIPKNLDHACDIYDTLKMPIANFYLDTDH